MTDQKKILNVGVLKKALGNYFEDIHLAVRVPGGDVYSITGMTMRSSGAENPLVFELLTEKDLDTRKIEPILLKDVQAPSRDSFQP